MDIISRKDAIAAGLDRYYTNIPCKHGHLCERRVNRYACVDCSVIHTKKRTDSGYFKQDYKNNRTRRLTTIKEYAKAHPDKVLKSSKDWNARNKEQQDQYRKVFYAVNDNRHHFLSSCREYRKKNPVQYRYYGAMRRAKKLKATPTWLTEGDSQAILQIYKEAQQLTNSTGIKHVVDHYYPLQGHNVSGLHCPGNLVIITNMENSKKHNYHPDDFYST